MSDGEDATVKPMQVGAVGPFIESGRRQAGFEELRSRHDPVLPLSEPSHPRLSKGGLGRMTG
jgi:hypothetical protein